MDERRSIAESAAIAATMDALPLSFCYQKKGLLESANALIKLGQLHPASVSIDVKNSLPSVNTVRDKITQMAFNVREDMKNNAMD